MESWLTPELKQDIRNTFEPRYKRKLSDKDVVEIAENLTSVVEEICKFKWREKYENGNK